MRARPCPTGWRNSLCVLRFRVTLRGATAGASRPWLSRRKVSNSSLASSLILSSAPLTLMPASSSCTSSRSTGTFRTSANWATVTSAICIRTSYSAVLFGAFEPVRAGRHDQLAGALGIQALDLFEVVRGLFRQLLPSANPHTRQGIGQTLVHAFQRQQVFRRLAEIELFLADDRLGNQHIASPAAQLLDDVFVELLDGHQLGSRHIGDLFHGRKAFLHQDHGDFLVHVQLRLEVLDQRAGLGFALFFRLAGRHHVELPAAQLAGEPDILAAPADGLRELFLLDGHVHAVGFLVHDDGYHLRRRHGVDDELGRVFVPGNDVHALARQFVRDGLDAGTPHAHTGADRIDALVQALDRDLRPVARVACRAQDLDQALAHLRHLEPEKLDNELRSGARQEDLRAARLGTHFAQVSLDAVLGAHGLPRDHLLAGDEAFGVAAEVHKHAVAVHALDDAADQGADAVLKLLHDLRALRLPHLLHHDLLRGLGHDAAGGRDVQGLFDIAVDLCVRVHVQRVLQAELAAGRHQLSGIVREDLPAPEGAERARLAVHRYARVDVFADELLARGGGQRHLQGLENDLFIELLFGGHLFDNLNDFLVHFS